MRCRLDWRPVDPPPDISIACRGRNGCPFGAELARRVPPAASLRPR